ncbi:hypothetical protein AKJ16_DCAP26507 [Drosera capensis]
MEYCWHEVFFVDTVNSRGSSHIRYFNNKAKLLQGYITKRDWQALGVSSIKIRRGGTSNASEEQNCRGSAIVVMAGAASLELWHFAFVALHDFMIKDRFKQCLTSPDVNFQYGPQVTADCNHSSGKGELLNYFTGQ